MTCPPTDRNDRQPKGHPTMAVSDQLTKLSARAKELEDRAAAASAKNKSDLEKDVAQARQAAQAQAAELRKSAENSKGQISAWWDSVQRSWNDHLKSVRDNVDEKKAAHDLKSAEKAADQADDDAVFAIDYAYAAIDEAEYAVLDAALARMEADDLAAAQSSGDS
ncbi:MAG TPA: hypothetical protein VGJ41_02350 [Nocardioides sp.]